MNNLLFLTRKGTIFAAGGGKFT